MLKKILILTVAGIFGLVAGWFGGELYYNIFGPSYGQFGYEFEGMDKAAIGAVIGLIVFEFVTYVLFIKKHRS